ncbi:MAG: MFS transporter [Patescibacteria group bacterium]|jgi:MFS family permease
MKTNWQKNKKYFLITTFFQWFYVAIGVWVLIWRNYLSWEEIALITSSGVFVSLLLELPSGALADMIGRRRTILLGRLLGIIGFALYSVADSFPLFLLGNIFYHANWAFESGALSALLFDSLKENNQEEKHYQKTESDAFFYATLGMALSSVIGGYLFKIDLHAPYIASAVIAFIAFLTALGLEEPTLDTEKFTLKNYLKQNWDGMKHIFQHPLIRSISIFSILINFVAYAGLWYLYEPRLAEAGFPASWMGWIVAGTYLIRAAGTKLIPYIMKLGDKNIPVALTVMQILGSFLSFWQTKAGAISSVYARKFADGFRKPILSRLQNEQIVSKYRATSLSAISLFENLLISAGGPLIGWAMTKYNVATTLGVMGIVGIVFILPSALIVSKQVAKASR